MDSDDLKAVGFWILNGLMLWGFSKICIEWNLPYWFLFAVSFRNNDLAFNMAYAGTWYRGRVFFNIHFN